MLDMFDHNPGEKVGESSIFQEFFIRDDLYRLHRGAVCQSQSREHSFHTLHPHPLYGLTVGLVKVHVRMPIKNAPVIQLFERAHDQLIPENNMRRQVLKRPLAFRHRLFKQIQWQPARRRHQLFERNLCRNNKFLSRHWKILIPDNANSMLHLPPY